MASLKEIKELAVYAVKGTAPAEYTVENVNAALADAIKELGGNINLFMKNRYDLYEIVIEAADEILPKKILSTFGGFAEIQFKNDGEKAVFKRGGLGKNRARKFLTQVGISGVYETFRLDNETFTLEGQAIGGAVTIDFQRWLDGAEDIQELMAILTEGMVDALYGEVQRCLLQAATVAPPTNVWSSATFEADKMVKLVNIAKAYGDGAIIYAPPEFIDDMGPDVITPAYQASMGSLRALPVQADIDAIHNTGRINLFRGTPIVEIPQSFTDENNKKTWVNPTTAYVFPTGKEKVVKIVVEGPTQIRDWTNKDGSIEIHSWKKMGAAILTYHNWCIYVNEGITDTSDPDLYIFN